jgi:hypothetical protein
VSHHGTGRAVGDVSALSGLVCTAERPQMTQMHGETKRST